MLDDPGSSSLTVALSILLVGLSALFSGSETAIFSLSAVRVRELVDKGVAGAKTVRRLLSDAHGLLSALMIGNNIVNTSLATLVTSLTLAAWSTTRGQNFAELAATLITTVTLLAFGEVTPKAIASYDPEGFAFFVARPVAFTVRLLSPLIAIANLLTGRLVAALGGRDTTPTVSVTEAVIETAMAVGEEAGALVGDERAMIQGVFASDDTPVGRAMVPRQRIVAVELGASLEGMMQVIVDSGLSRLPVYEGDIDHIVGIVYAKDLFVQYRRHRKGLPMTNPLRPPLFVHATGKVRPLINQMREQGTQLAIVRGADDRVAGLVTLEDLLEEVVGEIEDEHDLSLPRTAAEAATATRLSQASGRTAGARSNSKAVTP